MDKIEIKIRRGTILDAETLAPLAVKIFNDTFADNPLNKPKDMQIYIGEAFSLKQTRRELAEKDSIFFIAEIGGRMIGYAKLQEHSIEQCISDIDAIELQRLYVAHEFHGKGVAASLMNECFAEAENKNYQIMWLGVWEYNYRAQRFYEKFGFKKVGSHIFQLGTDAQIDFVMEKRVFASENGDLF